MSNPSDFFQAINDRKLWLFCKTCDAPKNYQDVEHIDSVENPTYWGDQPWWHDRKIFICPDCTEKQDSPIHLDE